MKKYKSIIFIIVALALLYIAKDKYSSFNISKSIQACLMGQKKLGLDNLEKLSIDDRKKIISDISKQKIENLKNEIPLGRIAESEDIADVVAFLSSDASRYISGETITVGGGKNQL